MKLGPFAPASRIMGKRVCLLTLYQDFFILSLWKEVFYDDSRGFGGNSAMSFSIYSSSFMDCLGYRHLLDGVDCNNTLFYFTVVKFLLHLFPTSCQALYMFIFTPFLLWSKVIVNLFSSQEFNNIKVWLFILCFCKMSNVLMNDD